jgi:hypothetical protein
MLTIKADVTAGSDIEQAFKDAIKLADTLNCFVEFDFNGILCSANPGGNAAKGSAHYFEQLNSKDSFKFATS